MAAVEEGRRPRRRRPRRPRPRRPPPRRRRPRRRRPRRPPPRRRRPRRRRPRRRRPRRRRPRRRRPRRPPAKKAPAKKAPAKKAAAKKAPAKKAPAKKAAGQEGAGQEGPGQEGRGQEGAGQEGAAKKPTAVRSGQGPAVADRPDSDRSRPSDEDGAVDALCDDLAAEHDDLDRVVSAGDLERADAGARLDGRRPDQPPLVLRPAGHAGADRPRRLRRRRRADPGRRSPAPGRTRRSSRAGPSLRTSCSSSGGSDRARLVDHARTLDPQGAGAVVRPGDERPLVHHGPADGDVGPRPGRRRRPRRRAAADRPAAPRRPHRRRRPSVQLRRQRPRAEPGAGAGRARRRRPATCGRGAPTMPPTGSRGPALDFCLLVTQRRHRDDVDARSPRAPAADEWLGIAQAFAGPPGPGRRPGQFA